jgi:hypothetical protein
LLVVKTPLPSRRQVDVQKDARQPDFFRRAVGLLAAGRLVPQE